MAELPHPWGVYASTQAQLSTRTTVGDRSWGLEAALNRLVVGPPLDPLQLATVQASAERRARYGRALLVHNTTALNDQGPSLEAQMEARSELVFLERSLSAPDMASLLAANLGHSAMTDAARQRVARARQRARMLLIK